MNGNNGGEHKISGREAVENDLIEQASEMQEKIFEVLGETDGMVVVNQSDLSALCELLEKKGVLTRVEWLTHVNERRGQLFESLRMIETPT